MAQLIAYLGTVDSGKSTLALQIDYTLRGRDLAGRCFTSHDRGGASISSRVGLSVGAVEVTSELDLLADVRAHQPLDYVVADEVQFYTPVQIEQLAAAVDRLNVDVYAFGLRTDFKGRLFPGTKRLVELADQHRELPIPAFCWCGERATHNARVVDAQMVTTGRLVDNKSTYQSLCRRHFEEAMVVPAQTRRKKVAGPDAPERRPRRKAG